MTEQDSDKPPDFASLVASGNFLNYNHISISSDSNPHSDPSLAVSLRLFGQKTYFTEKYIFREYRVETKGSIWRGVAPPPHMRPMLLRDRVALAPLKRFLKIGPGCSAQGPIFSPGSPDDQNMSSTKAAERDCSFCPQSCRS